MDENNKFETEIDFKALPKSPSRLFGWIFPYYAVLFLAVGVYFIHHMNDASLSSVPALYTDSLTINANVEVKMGGIMPAVDLGIISNPSNELIEKGKNQYNTICASCHGNEGKGDGAAAAALNPPPRNFHNTEGWTNGREFNKMYTTLQKGVPGTGMIAYEYMPVEDRIAIIQYVRTMADFPEITENEIAELDKTYELSKGVVTPSNITLEMAAEKIANENSKLVDIETAINKINSSSNKEVVELFNNYVLNKEKALSVFKRDFSNNTESEFIERMLLFPKESGFKTDASLLSKEDLSNLFKLLSSSLG